MAIALQPLNTFSEIQSIVIIQLKVMIASFKQYIVHTIFLWWNERESKEIDLGTEFHIASEKTQTNMPHLSAFLSSCVLFSIGVYKFAHLCVVVCYGSVFVRLAAHFIASPHYPMYKKDVKSTIFSSSVSVDLFSGGTFRTVYHRSLQSHYCDETIWWVVIPSQTRIYHVDPHGMAFNSNPTYRVS